MSNYIITQENGSDLRLAPTEIGRLLEADGEIEFSTEDKKVSIFCNSEGDWEFDVFDARSTSIPFDGGSYSGTLTGYEIVAQLIEEYKI